MTATEQFANNRFDQLRALGPAVFVAALLALIAFYWQGLVSLLQSWEKPEYSHGYIIPFIAVFLALKRLPERANTKDGLGFTAIAVTVLALLLGLFGRLSSIPDITTYGFLLAIAALGIATWGLKSAFQLWPAWVYLGFMLPLPNFIYWPLSIKLQFLSSEIGVAIIKLLGVPVFLDGNIIDLGSYQLQVAEACSGLRYLFPLMSFGFLFAVLYRGPTWHKILLFLSSIPITILMNSIRIGVIGYLVNHFGNEQAEGFLHFFEGWIIFAFCILLLFLIAVILQRLTRNPQPILALLDFDTDGLLQKFNRFGSATASRTVIAVLGLILLTSLVAATALSPKRLIPDRERLESYPMQLGEWTGTKSFLDFEIERVLGADDYLIADYAKPDGQNSVNLLVSYYKAQNEGSGIHSPEVCIPGGGWEVSNWVQSAVTITGPAAQTFNVNRAIIQKGYERQLVYYWFDGRSRKLTNDYVAKGFTVLDSISTGRSDGALIRVVTPMGKTETVESAGERLAQFLSLALAPMNKYVPN
jgi:exosortase D (VPLPA-CTERM-specific)